jgi:hypothetical protein
VPKTKNTFFQADAYFPLSSNVSNAGSISAYVGVLTGAPTFANNAIQVSPNNFVSISSTNNFSTPFTIAFDVLIGTGQIGDITLNKLSGSINPIAITFTFTTVSVKFNGTSIFSNVSIPSARFNTYILTYSSTVANLYINGVKNTTTFSQALAPGNTFNIGSVGVFSCKNFKLWNRVLSDSESANLFANGIVNDCIIQFKYTPIRVMSTTTGYTQSSFVGPTTVGTPDLNARLTLSAFKQYQPTDSFSTLTFYNLTQIPSIGLDSNATQGTQITCSLRINNVYYQSTLTTTNSAVAQVFRF